MLKPFPIWKPRKPALPVWMFNQQHAPKYEISLWGSGWVIIEDGHSWGVTFDTMQEAYDTMDGVLVFLGLDRPQ